MKLYVATRAGVVIAQRKDDQWQTRSGGLNGRNITSIMAREGVIMVGTEDGIFYSTDIGQSWSEISNGLSHRHVRWLAFHPDISDFEFAGTEPAAIFVSEDGGEHWHECLDVAALREQFGWWLPYSPEAGCVRGFAHHGQRVYAAVEVGGLLRSDDGGHSWRLAGGSNGRPQFVTPQPGFLHADVHSVAVHPTSPDLVFAPTGGGFFGSTDGGETWRVLYNDCYVRAVWIDPADAATMILGPAENASGRQGRIVLTHDGGHSWQRVAGPWPTDMVERFVTVGDEVWAVMANGGLWASSLAGNAWHPVLTAVANVNAITTNSA